MYIGADAEVARPPHGWGSWLAPAPLECLPADAAAVRTLLSDTRDLRVPVTPSFLASLRDDQHGLPYAPDEMLVGATERIPRLTALVAMQCLIPQNATEMHTTVMMAKFIDGVFETLNSNSHLALPYQTLYNSIERGTSSSTIVQNKRPDTIITVDYCTLLVGEDTSPGKLNMALDDLQAKVTNLSKPHYGEVRYLLAYAASGSQVQVCIIADGAQVLNKY
jgi:hypothetical protein